MGMAAPDDDSAVPSDFVPDAAALVLKGTACHGHMKRSHTAAGKRDRGRQAQTGARTKDDAKNRKYFHVEEFRHELNGRLRGMR